MYGCVCIYIFKYAYMLNMIYYKYKVSEVDCYDFINKIYLFYTLLLISGNNSDNIGKCFPFLEESNAVYAI